VDRWLTILVERNAADLFLVTGFPPAVRIDGIVVAYRIRTAERALGLELSRRMNRHQPQHGDSERLETVELRRDALEIAGG
jgi:Tfp pilus assembly ATPase PilU